MANSAAGVGSASEQPAAERKGAPATQSEANSGAERDLRLRAETLLLDAPRLGVEVAMAALADLETTALAVGGSGLIDGDVAASVVVGTVDALAARGAAWVEPLAADLDVRRLYDLVAGAPRPRLQRVVPVAARLGEVSLTSVDLWEDRAEARVVGPAGEIWPSLHLDAVDAGDRLLEVRDAGGLAVDVDLRAGRSVSEGTERRRALGPADYLMRLRSHAVGAARRDPSVDSLNAQRRRLAVAGEALGDRSAVDGFDAAVSGIAPASDAPALLEVVPVAARVSFGWVLSVERWTDHWRVVVRIEGAPASVFWTAIDGAGAEYGGEPMAGEVIRFDGALPDSWSSVTLASIGAHGELAEVEVVRT